MRSCKSMLTGINRPCKPVSIVGLLGLLLVTMFVVPGCGGTGQSISEEEQLIQAHGSFRARALSAMKEAARLRGLQLYEDDFAAAAVPLPDGSVGAVVNTAIAGAENLTLSQLEVGADVMFLFVPFAITGLAAGDNDGFYIVRVFKDEAGRWRFLLRNRSDQTVLTGDALVNESDTDRPRKFSFSIGSDGLCVDFWIIKICATVELDRGLITPPAPGQQILDAASELARNGVRCVTSTLPDKSWRVRTPLVGGANGFFVLHTNLESFESLTLDELANGQNAFVIFARGTELDDGFYIVRLLQEGGQWKAQFKNVRTGQVVLTKDAVVEEMARPGPIRGLTMDFPGPDPLRQSCTIDWEGPLGRQSNPPIIRIEIKIIIRL